MQMLVEVNSHGLTIIVSANSEPRYGHFTSNSQQGYYGNTMRYYQLFIEIHVNMCTHHRRQWFRCTLRHPYEIGFA